MFSRLFFVTLFAVLVASCSSGSSESSANLVEIEPVQDNAVTAAGSTVVSAPGVIYMTSSTGDLVAFRPTTSEIETVWSYVPDELVAFDIAPAARSTGLHVVLTDPARQIATSLHMLQDGVVLPVENDFFSSLTICMDQHSAADVSVGHALGLTDGTDGSAFAPVFFDGGEAVDASTFTELTRVSVVCPRWNADRTIVATAAPIAPGDRSTVVTYVDTPDGSFEISVAGCSITPTSFSPDDAFLAVDVGCFDDAWQSSGLYLVDMASLDNELTLADMTKIGDGIYGRSTWHPGGEWIVATRVDVIEGQSVGTDYTQEVFTFAMINVATGEARVQQLPDQASVGTFAWLETAPEGS